MPTHPDPELQSLARRRFRLGAALSAAMIAVYFGFTFLVAFGREQMAAPIVPGLSWGIALGAAVIGVAWLLTGAYVWWANARYDAEIARLAAREGR